jgi:hypothetical protein
VGEEVGSVQSEYQRHQARYHDEWNTKIYEHMSNIDGLRVQTTVMLTTPRNQQMFNMEQRKPTPLVTHAMDYSFMKEADGQGEEHDTEITNALPGMETKIEEAMYIPLQVRVSIQIPRDHVRAVWQKKNQSGGDLVETPNPEELLAEEESLTLTTKRSIGKLLETYRISNKTDPMELVEVAYYESIQLVEAEPTAWERWVLFVKFNGQQLGLMSLVFCGLTVLLLVARPVIMSKRCGVKPLETTDTTTECPPRESEGLYRTTL